MKDAAPVTIHLKDYQKSPYQIETVYLELQLDPEKTEVKSTMIIHRSPGFGSNVPLELNGEDMTFLVLR